MIDKMTLDKGGKAKSGIETIEERTCGNTRRILALNIQKIEGVQVAGRVDNVEEDVVRDRRRLSLECIKVCKGAGVDEMLIPSFGRLALYPKIVRGFRCYLLGVALVH